MPEVVTCNFVTYSVRVTIGLVKPKLLGQNQGVAGARGVHGSPNTFLPPQNLLSLSQFFFFPFFLHIVARSSKFSWVLPGLGHPALEGLGQNF